MRRRRAQEAAAKPAKGQPKLTDQQLKDQCKQQYEQLRDQVLGLLISFEWIEREAKDQGVKVTDAEVDKSFEEQKKQTFPKDADYEKFLKDSGQTEEDVRMRVRLDLLFRTRSATRSIKGKDQVSDAADPGLLRQEQGALRPARAARPLDRPDQDGGQGEGGQAGARGRRVLSSRWPRSTRSTTPPRRRAASCRPWPRASRRRRSTTRSSRPRRASSGPGQDAVRLVRLRGRQDHRGLAADARRGQGDDQAAARLAEPAEGARRLRQGLPQAVEGRRRTAARAS